MSTDSTSISRPATVAVETKVSGYDLLNSLLIASILIVGFLVSVLFLIWLTTAFDFSKQRQAIAMEQVDEPGDEKPLGEADDIHEPGVEEFPEVEEPQLAMALEAVTNSVSSVRASLEKRSGSAEKMGRGSGFGSRTGGSGSGGDGIPEWKRWIITYEAPNIDEYAKQLSQLKVDIGIVHMVRTDIWRLRDPGGSPRVIKSDRTKENKSLRFSHTNAKMRRWDQTLARRQNIELDETIPCQFYPESTRLMIRRAEAEALQGTGKQLSEVRNTIFKVEPGEGGFVFTVIEILYR